MLTAREYRQYWKRPSDKCLGRTMEAQHGLCCCLACACVFRVVPRSSHPSVCQLWQQTLGSENLYTRLITSACLVTEARHVVKQCITSKPSVLTWFWWQLYLNYKAIALIHDSMVCCDIWAQVVQKYLYEVQHYKCQISKKPVCMKHMFFYI